MDDNENELPISLKIFLCKKDPDFIQNFVFRKYLLGLKSRSISISEIKEIIKMT